MPSRPKSNLHVRKASRSVTTTQKKAKVRKAPGSVTTTQKKAKNRNTEQKKRRKVVSNKGTVTAFFAQRQQSDSRKTGRDETSSDVSATASHIAKKGRHWGGRREGAGRKGRARPFLDNRGRMPSGQRSITDYHRSTSESGPPPEQRFIPNLTHRAFKLSEDSSTTAALQPQLRSWKINHTNNIVTVAWKVGDYHQNVFGKVTKVYGEDGLAYCGLRMTCNCDEGQSLSVTEHSVNPCVCPHLFAALTTVVDQHVDQHADDAQPENDLHPEPSSRDDEVSADLHSHIAGFFKSRLAHIELDHVARSFQTEGFQYHPVPGDGSCFFHSLKKFLDIPVVELRKQFAQHLRKLFSLAWVKETWFLLDPSVTKHKEFIELGSTDHERFEKAKTWLDQWAHIIETTNRYCEGQWEIQESCICFQVNIRLWVYDDVNRQLKLHTDYSEIGPSTDKPINIFVHQYARQSQSRQGPVFVHHRGQWRRGQCTSEPANTATVTVDDEEITCSITKVYPIGINGDIAYEGFHFAPLTEVAPVAVPEPGSPRPPSASSDIDNVRFAKYSLRNYLDAIRTRLVDSVRQLYQAEADAANFSFVRCLVCFFCNYIR